MSRVRSVTAAPSASRSGCERGGHQRHRHEPHSREFGHGPVQVVERLEHDHLVAGFGQREDRRRECLGRARGDQHLALRIDVDAVPPSLVRRDRITQHRHPATGRVLVHPVADRLPRGLEHLGGTVLIGEPLPEVDRAGRDCERAHLREDALLHAAVGAEQHRPACRALPGTVDGHEGERTAGAARAKRPTYSAVTTRRGLAHSTPK